MRLLILLPLVLCASCDFSPPVQPISRKPPTPAEPLSTLAVPADNEFAAKIVGVIDGDTVDVLRADKSTVRIRFNGIDCPERGQPFGNNAKKFVSAAAHDNPNVVIVDHGEDRYGRTIGDVMIDRASLNFALVAAGLAWHYKKYSDDESLAAAENAAREAKRGLWSDPRHVPPWEWRKLSKAERDALR